MTRPRLFRRAPGLPFVAACAFAAAVAAMLSGVGPFGGRAAADPPRDHYAAPDGRADAAGTPDDPWDLSTALSGRAAVAPGDTIWLAGGVYSGAFVSEIAGTGDLPIVVRSLPGVRATLDGAGFADPVLTVRGGWTVFQDFEVTNSDASRPPIRDARPTGVAVFAEGSRFVHLQVHDVGQGFGFWSEAPDSEIYGCLIYDNGTTPFDHGIYVQNRTGAKRMIDNVVFHNAGCGIHGYGTSAARLASLWIEGNALFDNGVLTTGGTDPSPNLLVGGGSPVTGLRVFSNATWTRKWTDTSAQFGSDTPSVDAIVQGNRFVGYVHVLNWAALSMAGNSFVGSTTLVALETTLTLPSPFLGWDDNRYVSGEREWQPFSLLTPAGSRGLWYPGWQAATGSDENSEYFVGSPSGTEVIVRPSRWEPGRASVIAYDWSGAPSVTADLSGVFAAGDDFEIRSAQDPYGAALVRGTYDGTGVSIPMRAGAVAVPVGLPAPPSTAPQFDVFLVTSSAASPAPTPTRIAAAPTPRPTAAGPPPATPTPADVTPRRPPKDLGF